MTRVVVTGLGLSTSLGQGIDANWQRVAHQQPSSRGLLPEQGLDRAQVLTQQAADEALQRAALWNGTTLEMDAERLGCTYSASKPLFDRDSRPQAPDTITDFVTRRYGIQGEKRNVIAACATGAYAIAQGASWIEQGFCDVVLAGSVEPRPHPLIEAGFQQMGVVTSDPVMKPFDQNRSGFVFGEGAGVVVLESEDHAKRRGAMSWAVLSGWGLGADGHSAIAFNSNGQKIAHVIAHALNRARLDPSHITHVNAHGTATRHNDWIETQALLKAFGSHAEALQISATKAATGHLLGAAGSVEFVLTVLALHRQWIPPTESLDTPDPECPLQYTPKSGRAVSFDHALSLSFGFGGPIGALVVSHA